MNARRVCRTAIRIGAALLVTIALIIGWRSTMRYRYEHARQDWKNETLQSLAGMSITNDQIMTELYQIKNPTPTLDVGWVHDHVIPMTNGECLIYAFRHGSNNDMDHLFLAHGTDGKWYYSSYHFCNRMVGILADGPSGSIREFAKRYSLREFDGKSDECLKHTWSPIQ
jgi:hypothetical protein